MRTKAIWLLAVSTTWILCGCGIFGTDEYRMDLTFNGKPRDRIYYAAQKQQLGGAPFEGEYSGPGVEDGYFYPKKIKNDGKYEIRHTHKSLINKIGIAEIEVFGRPPIPKIIPCAKCGNTGKVVCDVCKECDKCGSSRKVKEVCAKCGGRGYTRIIGFKKGCNACNKSGAIEVGCPKCKTCEKCHGEHKIPCPDCHTVVKPKKP